MFKVESTRIKFMNPASGAAATIRCQVFSSGYQYVRFASTCTQSVLTLSRACQDTPLSYLFPARATCCVPQRTPLYIPALYPMPLSNPRRLQAAAVYPSRCFIFPVTWSGPIRLQVSIVFSGTAGPVGPTGPVGPIGPRRCGLYYIFRD